MNHHESLANSAIPKKLIPTMEALLDGAVYSADTASSIWHFAISIQRLHELGATETDLRWLVSKGLVDHGREVTVEGDDGRAFRPTGNLTFSTHTCFVLTDTGIVAAQTTTIPANGEPLREAPRRDPPSDAPTEAPTNAPSAVLPSCSPCEPVPSDSFYTETPQWDADSRKLQLNARIVKRFKWPAMNQEAVLCAFQEEGWPERIDDPLPPQAEQDSKRRLADTIKCLNRKQTNKLIHFRGDGTGEGVVWEHVEGNGQAESPTIL